jgi:UDP-galactopyranose mutase
VRILVIGAGFAGAVHARELAEAGHDVRVLDRRPHIGGNAFDEVDANGVRVHRYGPHLFHTRLAAVAEWVGRFADWVPYEHRVRARLADGRHVPLPVNRRTLEEVFGVALSSPEEARAFLASLGRPGPDAPRNAAEHLVGAIGPVLTDLFFRPYTKKMWGHSLEEMAPSVVKRIPVRFDDDSRYFPQDAHQMLPRDGYTILFTSIFNHPRIAVELGTPYQHGMEERYDICFNSMAIDEFFGFALGELPYRSIRFHHHTTEAPPPEGWAVTNYTDDGPFTRETHWDALPGHRVRPGPRRTVTSEEPCDYRDNAMERYYPVRTSDDRHGQLYHAYAAKAALNRRMRFIGRCGTYQYLDMDQVINQSLASVRRFLEEADRPPC